MILILFVDALGYHYLDDPEIRRNFGKVFKSIVPAESFLAYSAGIHASIWTSSYIVDHGKWLGYYLESFPETEIRISELLWKMESMATFISKRLTGNYSKYYVPKVLSRYFRKLNYDFDSPYYHEEIPSFFKVLEKNNVSFEFSHLTTTKELQLTDLEHDVNVIFVDEFDALGHRLGPNSKETKRRILELLTKIEKNMEKATGATVFLFSDHGMNRINQRLNAFKHLKRLEKHGFKPGKDYVFFVDSTLIRFWVKSEKVNKAIFEVLSNEPGHFVSLEEKEKYKIPLSGDFGDLIFLTNPGVEVFPNFFHPSYSRFIKGLHGYAPETYNSYGLFATNMEPKPESFSLLDVSPTILKFIGVKKPRVWKGKAHDLS